MCGNLQYASYWYQRSLPAVECNSDKLSLALEPESAAIYCQNMSQQNAATYCQAAHPFMASCFIVVDIGGGTVDLSAYRISPTTGHIEIIHPPTGNDCGGARINDNFMEFLGGLVNDRDLARYLKTPSTEINAKHSAELNYLIRDTFEKQKRLFGTRSSPSAKFGIHLPYSFMETYQSDIQQGLKQHKSGLQLTGNDLRVTYAKMEEFFKPTVDGLLSCVDDMLQEIGASRVKAVYLVGGFGGCRFIHTAVCEKFGDQYKYIVPAEPDFAVVRGAILSRYKPDIVQGRRVDATYGVGTNIAFDPSIHDPEYKWVNDDHVDYCQNVFSPIVERGDIVSTTEVLVKGFVPIIHQQKQMRIDFYSSQEKDIWYTTGKRGKSNRINEPVKVSKIGTFTIDMPILTGDKSRVVDLTFDFSHTEIQVKGYDRTSGNEVKVVLDFLSA